MDLLRRVRMPLDNQLLAKFRCQFESENITRKEYILKFISTFVKNDISENVEFTEVIKKLHECVDKTSLCKPEIKFFHRLIDCDVPMEKYIDTLEEIYYQTSNLSNCQLGKVIKRCLEASNKLKF
jgi:hypothetical protein